MTLPRDVFKTPSSPDITPILQNYSECLNLVQSCNSPLTPIYLHFLTISLQQYLDQVNQFCSPVTNFQQRPIFCEVHSIPIPALHDYSNHGQFTATSPSKLAFCRANFSKMPTISSVPATLWDDEDSF